MSNYNQPNLPHPVKWLVNTITKGMQVDHLLKCSTRDYPDDTFVIRLSQIKAKHKTAQVIYNGHTQTHHYAPTSWNPNGRYYSYRPKSVTNIGWSCDRKDYVFSWGSGGEMDDSEFYSFFQLANSVKDFLKKI